MQFLASRKSEEGRLKKDRKHFVRIDLTSQKNFENANTIKTMAVNFLNILSEKRIAKIIPTEFFCQGNLEQSESPKIFEHIYRFRWNVPTSSI